MRRHVLLFACLLASQVGVYVVAVIWMSIWANGMFRKLRRDQDAPASATLWKTVGISQPLRTVGSAAGPYPLKRFSGTPHASQGVGLPWLFRFRGAVRIRALAVAPVSFGGAAVGLLSIGGAGIGLATLGGFALGGWAFGGFALGWQAFAVRGGLERGEGGIAVALDLRRANGRRRASQQ